MNREEDPQLWDLLGRSKGAAPSPFLSRNVVRAVRTEIPERDGLSGWFNLRRLIPAFSAAAAVAIAVHLPSVTSSGFAWPRFDYGGSPGPRGRR